MLFRLVLYCAIRSLHKFMFLFCSIEAVEFLIHFQAFLKLNCIWPVFLINIILAKILFEWLYFVDLFIFFVWFVRFSSDGQKKKFLANLVFLCLRANHQLVHKIKTFSKYCPHLPFFETLGAGGKYFKCTTINNDQMKWKIKTFFKIKILGQV